MKLERHATIDRLAGYLALAGATLGITGLTAMLRGYSVFLTIGPRAVRPPRADPHTPHRGSGAGRAPAVSR